MPVEPSVLGRRERNKQEKRQRIIAAAGELFAEFGADDVTTQQIADKADIGTGTLFLYAKTKGELLLLVQNAHYADALERGRADAAATDDLMDALEAIVRPIVQCNRIHVGNGRTYLREMIFGDAGEPHHAEALAIAAETEVLVAGTLQRCEKRTIDAERLARVISSVMFVTMAATADPTVPVDDVVREILSQIDAVLNSPRSVITGP